MQAVTLTTFLATEHRRDLIAEARQARRSRLGRARRAFVSRPAATSATLRPQVS